MSAAIRPVLAAARAYGKVNLHLGVGERRPDGYHELSTVFQSLDVSDIVRLREAADTGKAATAEATSPVVGLSVTQSIAGDVPADSSNLAWRAVDAVAAAYRERHGQRAVPSVVIDIEKHIPVAGGMAGGSADAAAALVAADAWLAGEYGVDGLTPSDLATLARGLGADVPFVLLGGTAAGTGRGDELVTMLSRGNYHWAMVTSDRGLSTPSVFAKLDELRAQRPGHCPPTLDTSAVAKALVTGDPQQLASALHNDLQAAALSLRPDLRRVLRVGIAEGALAGIVSGSGPTCALLCEDQASARLVGAAVVTELPGTRALALSGPAGGAHLVES